MRCARRRTLAFVGTVGLVGAVALLGASSAQAEDPRLQRHAAEQYARDTGVSVAEATRRLETQDQATPHLDRVGEVIGQARYGSSWFGGDPYGLRIGVVGGVSALTDAERSEIGKLIKGPYRYVEVAASIEQLRTEQARLNDRLRGLLQARKVMTSQQPSRNRLRVVKARGLSADEEDEIGAGTRARRVKVDVVSAQSSQVGGKPLACSGTAAGWAYCDRPLHGGVAIHDEGGGTCTAGFNARTTTGGYYVVLTAGHCPALGGGASWWWHTRKLTGGISGFSLGYPRGYRWGPDDVAMINTSSNLGAYWLGPPAPSPYVLVAMPGYRNDNYPIRQEVWSYEGRIVCITSGGRRNLANGDYTACGPVTQLGLSFTSCTVEPQPRCANLDGMTEADICGIDQGASGGPVIKDEAAFGLLSTGSYTAGSCLVTYQEILEAEGIAGAQVLHP